MFTNDSESRAHGQDFVVAERGATDFSISEGLVSLLASYYTFYINYPKSSPATDILLLFMQELLLSMPDTLFK